jgi:hypothetical protein
MEEHRLSSASDEPVRILEISFGEFDEDDIVRAEDAYGRVPREMNHGASDNEALGLLRTWHHNLPQWHGWLGWCAIGTEVTAKQSPNYWLSGDRVGFSSL